MANYLGQPFPQPVSVNADLINYLGQVPQEPQQRPFSERLGNALMTTWPVQMAKSAFLGATLPGDVYAGRVDPMSNEALGRSVDLAGLATLGSFPVASVGRAPGEVVLGSAATRAAKNVDELRAVLAKEHPSVKSWVSESAGRPLTVSKVIVPESERGRGIGTTFMRDVLDYADSNGKTVALTPDGSFGGNKAKLEAWYKSLGFSQNKGRKADHSISEKMYRLPE
jgi:predicted GNAT family acetyltransferase